MQSPDRSIDGVSTADVDDDAETPCPCCGGRMRIIEVFERGQMPKHQPSPRPFAIRIDTS
jgi:hypothetical protein